MRQLFMGLLLCATVCGCAQLDALRAPHAGGAAFYGAPHPVSTAGAARQLTGAAPFICERYTPLAAGELLPAARGPGAARLDEVPFSPGDLLELLIAHDNDFSGRYVIDENGRLALPHIAAVPVAGQHADGAAMAVERALVEAGMLRPGRSRVTVRVLQWAAIDVTVSGAVFQPGRVRINEAVPAAVMQERTAASGDFAVRRSLSEALRAASGVRPDADLAGVIVVRGDWRQQVDLTGIMHGHPARDLPLAAGDAVFVPSTGCFQPQLVRPSQITPKGFRAFMSNLIVPALDNASGAVGSYSTNLPYGTRLLQAAVSANCVGGVQATSASRKVVLASHNPLTGGAQVIERSVEALLRTPVDPVANPYLMPNDAVACYDSAVTNMRDVARTLADLFLPLRLL